MRSNITWPAIILFSAYGSALSIYGGWEYPFHSLVVLWFLLICPGMAFVELLSVQDRLQRWVLAIAVSICVDTAIALILLYMENGQLMGIIRPDFVLFIVLVAEMIRFKWLSPKPAIILKIHNPCDNRTSSLKSRVRTAPGRYCVVIGFGNYLLYLYGDRTIGIST
jgi:hypothetical protein